MKYITISDLSETIRKNIWKIPRDIDFIIGIPRSGMIGASIIASYLNVPLIDVDSFLEGREPWGGLRLEYFTKNHQKTNKVLVIDDTVSSGGAMKKNKKKIADKNIRDVEYVYACVYLEGWGGNEVDFYLEDLRKYTNNFTEYVMYEWNIFQHHEETMKTFLFDMDGVFCVDPPDERNEEKYIDYIKNATPLFIPRTKIGGIVTYRLNKNMDITKKWLNDNGIKYNHLIMFNANSWEERNEKGISPELYKASYYKQHNEYKLFIESNDNQAKKIAEISQKPCFCVETNKMYELEKPFPLNKKDNVDIFVGTYKDVNPPLTNKAYKIIVGNHEIKNNSKLELIKCGDDKDVLDDRFYSEIYMLRKLVENNYPFKDYVGFCHYRKLFSFMDKIPDIDECFKTCDAIIGKPISQKKGVGYQYALCHNFDDLKLIGEIIKDKYPEYFDTYKNVLLREELIPYNMFIMKKEDFLKYMEFINGILDEFVKIIGTDIEQHIENNKDKYLKKYYPNSEVDYQYRIGGYLAERITNIFLFKNMKKIKAYPVKITEGKYKNEEKIQIAIEEKIKKEQAD